MTPLDVETLKKEIYNYPWKALTPEELAEFGMYLVGVAADRANAHGAGRTPYHKLPPFYLDRCHNWAEFVMKTGWVYATMRYAKRWKKGQVWTEQI